MAKLAHGPKAPRLKKRFGQNHLLGGHLCRPLLDYLSPSGQRVLEIGPGGGVLTAELKASGARVWACEVDLEWAFHLRRHFAPHAIGLMAMDATGFPWERLPAPTLVSGNLPFNVATRLIEALLPHWENVPRAAFMVQKEVAERLAAGPGDAAYGSFSVIVSSAAQVSLLGTLKPGCFRPAPKVSAAFVGLQLGKPLLPKGEMPAFHRFVRQCFAQRRKTLRNSLSAALGREASGALLAAAGLDSRSRAGELDLKMFVHLFRYLGQMNK